MTSNRATTLGAGLAVAAALALASTAASAANAGKEAQTAAVHANLSAKSTSLKMVKTHLHHVVNCLVGSKDPRFDKHELNPCQGMGRGAILDARTKTTVKELRAALREAERGLKAKSVTVAQKDARTTGVLLAKAIPTHKSAMNHKAAPKKPAATTETTHKS